MLDSYYLGAQAEFHSTVLILHRRVNPSIPTKIHLDNLRPAKSVPRTSVCTVAILFVGIQDLTRPTHDGGDIRRHSHRRTRS